MRPYFIGEQNFDLKLDSLYMGRNISVSDNYAPIFPKDFPKIISIGNSVTSIPMMLFAYSDISELSLPSSLKTIGREAFCKCTNLDSIYYFADKLVEGSTNIFSSYTYRTATLYLSEAGMKDYKNINPWMNFQNVKESLLTGLDDIITNFNPNTPIEIYDLKGKNVTNSVSKLPKGIYVVRTGKGVKKIIVK